MRIGKPVKHQEQLPKIPRDPTSSDIEELHDKVVQFLADRNDLDAILHHELAMEVSLVVEDMINSMGVNFDADQQFEMATSLIDDIIAARNGEQSRVLIHQPGLTKFQAVKRAQSVTGRTEMPETDYRRQNLEAKEQAAHKIAA